MNLILMDASFLNRVGGDAQIGHITSLPTGFIALGPCAVHPPPPIAWFDALAFLVQYRFL